MCVRTSTASYGSFSLAMGRSPGFGSAAADLFALLRLGFPPAPHLLKCLTSPAPATRRTVLQKVRGRAFALPQFEDTGFQVLFHSPPGVLFTFPSQYCSLSVNKSIQPWRVVPPVSHRVSRVPWYSGVSLLYWSFAYTSFTFSGWLSQNHSATLLHALC